MFHSNYQFRLTGVNELLYAFKKLIEENRLSYKVKVFEIGE